MRPERYAYLLALAMIGWVSACDSTAPTGPTPDLPQPLPPTVELRACMLTEPQPPVVGTETQITLNGSCSTSGSEIVGYTWDLGDGRQKTGEVIHPQYTDSGNYDVILTVEDSAGRRDSVTTGIVVYQAAKACFDWNRIAMNEQDVPCNYHFDASCSAGDIVEYRWFFEGDPRENHPDRTVVTETPEITYDWSGDTTCLAFRPFERVVRLSVVTREGDTDSIEKLVQISEPSKDPNSH